MNDNLKTLKLLFILNTQARKSVNVFSLLLLLLLLCYRRRLSDITFEFPPPRSGPRTHVKLSTLPNWLNIPNNKKP